MKSLTILQAEKNELLKSLRTQQDILKKCNASIQPQITIVIADIEQQIVEAEKAINSFKKIIKKEVQDEKAEVKEDEDESAKWASFCKALEVFEETQMCFHKSAQPTYFYKKTYQDFDIKTGVARSPTTELLTFPSSSLGENWLDLKSEAANNFFKRMVHGHAITIKNPDTNELKTYPFEKKVYTKLGNTRHTPDKETFNMIDLSGIMKPTGKQEICPEIIHQLLLALSGNVETVNDDGSITLSKPENYEWLCKWLYGVLVADIGNNMLSMPVMFGSGKVGKNAMFDKIFPRVLGTELCFTGLWENMDGSFNGFKLGKIFIFLDEIPPRDDWNKLKNLTGSVTELIKKKYGPEFVIENTVALAVGSNQVLFPLPMEDGKQMTRVSPIKTDPRSTFAENTFKLFERSQPGFLIDVLNAQGIDTTLIANNPYELGDKFLRNNDDMWCNMEQIQSFLNFLHNKFADEKFTLSPLRGRDWEEILRTKPNPLNQVVEYVKETKIGVITTAELFEIYKVIIGEKKSTQFIKGIQNFGAQIWPLLEAEGFARKLKCRVMLDISISAKEKQKVLGNSTTPMSQSTVFHKPHLSPEGHKQCIEEYIVIDMLNNTKHLIYPDIK